MAYAQARILALDAEEVAEKVAFKSAVGGEVSAVESIFHSVGPKTRSEALGAKHFGDLHHPRTARLAKPVNNPS
eukprot:CAMPEP_0171632800 /NCGR_PEP_ID=MMETSP0990-20121206/24717_1 /TAXON_ID=483369 /ORGANISM="non described non described, Strain CCMP2098" /LENGTH=73 /DNA_ID=CAMNT_0012203183 /DNA_START=187 /DNA_END=404 /DNA_ORIENTATION=+